MKVVLVHGRYFNSWEALGLAYIGAYIQQHEPLANVQFYQGCFDDDDEIVSGCMSADIVGFSCTSPSFKHVTDLAQRIKRLNPHVHTVVGGYHASALPEQCLIPGVIDQVVVGEGEHAMLEIVRGIRKPILQGRRMKFEELSWPNRGLVSVLRNMDAAAADNGMRITSFQCHRACPFACRYCADGRSNILYQGEPDKRAWYRSIDDVLNEMASVTETYGLGQAKFSDPTWNTDVEWATEFSRKKIEMGLDVEFYPNIHARQVTQEMADLMREANCTKVAMGVESGSPKVLKAIGKGTKVEHIRDATRMFKQAGIEVRGFFIVGMPCETDEDLRMTEDFAAELDLDEYGFTLLCPYPGTYLYDHSRFKDVKWEETDEYANDFWHTDHLSNEELKAWQSRLVDRFSERICWHNRILSEGV